MPDSKHYLPEHSDLLGQAPIYSAFSAGVVMQHALSSADSSFQVGAVIWHPQSQRFLLFIKRKGRYHLPAEFVEGGIWSSFSDPLGFVARETGHKIERVPLRNYVRRYGAPYSAESDDVGLEPVVGEEPSVDAFHVTVGRLWDADQKSPWGEPRQVVTFWFAGVIVDENPPAVTPAKPAAATIRVGHLVGLHRTFNDFLNRGFEDFPQYAALQTFVKLWNKTYPDKAI